MECDMYHIIVYAPPDVSNLIRSEMAKAGAGHIGNYDNCSFSCKGKGRFRPLIGATPAIGTEGQIEEVDEERIEAAVTPDKISDVIEALKKAHPYEEPAIHVLPMFDYKNFKS